MTTIRRRDALKLAGATAAMGGVLPRFAIAQADNRPTITVTVQKISNSNTLDCLREQSNVGTRMATMYTERLIDLNYQGRLESVPGLATEWRRIDDKTVELKLRPGVKMHNGDEFTAEDVAASFSPQRMFGETRPTVQGKTLPLSGQIVTMSSTKELPREIPPVARRLWPGFDRIDIVDKYTVRVVNGTPDVTIEGRLSARGSDMVSGRAFSEANSWLEYARKPVGTGPYRIREFKPDTYLVMDAHDEYWGGRPPIKTLRLVEVPEVSSRVNGLLSGEYQFACDMPPDQIVDIERHPGFEVQGGTIPNHRITAFDRNHAPLRDPRMRQAMTHAIDRKAIVDSLWAGRTRVPNGLQWEFYADMFVADWRVPEFDLDKARALVKAAGYKGDPITYRLLSNYYTNQVATAQVMVEMWRAAGLNVQIEMKENWTQVFERGPGRGIRDWSNSAVFNDPVSSIVSQHGPNGEQQQYGEWTNEEMNRLSLELETSTDRPRRRAMFARMLQICEREDPAYSVLHQTATFIAKRKDIRWQAAPSFAMDFRAHNWGA
ncbi:ABC transporter substrate-binding protein [Limobrevibacterium gyesilva]|uniref:ABC transporter substrate-binding protein n=1 Tax=Limobrevibacterium gyesilva TaxID=2991712 RepID=A0AA41YLN1_9PROT|nr:ABC transporter substrate-binding protein [Limobrevibacterium gyesilva]MCW3476121.1 ABC transporter substrate-binding protein [Limobrevibacterium gyesilva]